MKLQKPFDLQALINGLKAQGIVDAEKVVNDAVPTFFDWLNSSVQAETSSIPWAGVAIPVLQTLEAKAQTELQALEQKLNSAAS